MPSEVELRRAQEDIARMREGGFHMELVKLHWAFFSAYIEIGFTRQEALGLVKELIQGQFISQCFDDDSI